MWQIGQHCLDSGCRVRLVISDQTGGAALGPPDDIFTWYDFTGIRMHDLPCDIVDGRGRMVEWHTLNWHTSVANQAHYQANLNDLKRAGSFRSKSAIEIHDELIALDPH